MKIMTTGIDYSTAKPLIDPIDTEEFADKVRGYINKNVLELQNMSVTGKRARAFRDILETKPDPNKNNPREVGWTFLINSNDPQKDEIINAIRPLAEFRGMSKTDSPLLYNGESIEGWRKWLEDNYKKPETDPSYYVLIVGEPELIPFEFQSFLAIAASVGRLDFDSIEDLKSYVNKIIRLESTNLPVVKCMRLPSDNDRRSSNRR
jgi:hypothetical protein